MMSYHNVFIMARHCCAACGTKKDQQRLYRFVFHPLTRAFWLCSECSGKLSVIVDSEPVYSYLLVKDLSCPLISLNKNVLNTGQNFPSPTANFLESQS